ncbi:hypothetical protein B0T17DRAFT_502551 [Bombardia bombarda]|uniref:Fucose-specific lectin n=1 Tax=Bombardia bombarda TaxID=252184 RepID=A0AA40CDN0_9PEZI|nr:hypothetical protein B0T17DRAFT_502551 [Bombardia bombarda]
MLALIAMALGLGIGLNGKSSSYTFDWSSSSSSDSGTGSTTADGTTNNNNNNDVGQCGGSPRNQIRRQVLSATVLDSNLFMFARGQDNSTWYRSLPTDFIASRNNSDWSRLLPSSTDTFAGPPTAISWLGSRLNVFAPSSHLSNVLTASYVNGTWTSFWENLGASAASPVALCTVPAGAFVEDLDRIDQWVIDSHNDHGVVHDGWNFAQNDFYPAPAKSEWDTTMSDLASASMPAILCHKTDPIYSLLVFGNSTDSLRIRHYLGATDSWTDWADLGGTFRGDPVAVDFRGGQQFHFFGTGTDGIIYTFIWSNGTQATTVGYRPEMVSLQGNFSSVPSAVVTETEGDDGQVDVVALGADGAVKHRAFRMGSWGRTGRIWTWGVGFRTAPRWCLALRIQTRETRRGLL